VVDCRPDPDPLLALLSPEEERQARGLQDVRVRAQFVHCRSSLRRELGTRFGMLPGAIPIGVGAHGKPCLTLDDPLAVGLDFSISHGRDWGLVALSDVGPVGVDLEADRTVARPLALARRFFPAELTRELEAVTDDAERGRLFLYYWTRLEAQAKAHGLGLLRFLARLTGEVPGEPAAPRFLESFSPMPGYQGALCLLDGTPSACETG